MIVLIGVGLVLGWYNDASAYFAHKMSLLDHRCVWDCSGPLLHLPQPLSAQACSITRVTDVRTSLHHHPASAPPSLLPHPSFPHPTPCRRRVPAAQAVWRGVSIAQASEASVITRNIHFIHALAIHVSYKTATRNTHHWLDPSDSPPSPSPSHHHPPRPKTPPHHSLQGAVR